VSDQALQWYVLRTAPVHRIEFDVMYRLQQREHPAMVPFEEKHIPQRFSRHTKRKKFPLFVGYVFAGLRRWEDFLDIRANIPQVIGVVGFNGKPAKLADDDVSFLQALSVEGMRIPVMNPHRAFAVGQRARIRFGHAFSGQEVLITDIQRKHVEGMMEIFNTRQTVKLSMLDLEAA